jgi:DNA-binding FadR family transcriptional regulator
VAETADSLREGIQNGHWHDRLPGERELCESLQVSRRTLRSALAELGHDGWLEVEGRQGRRIKKRGSVTQNARNQDARPSPFSRRARFSLCRRGFPS